MSAVDLAHLTRPTVVCQCSHCSTSLAACENAWVRLASSFSTAVETFTVDQRRISLLGTQQISSLSDMRAVRGCTMQDIHCSTCRVRVGVLIHMQPEARIFWKMSRITLRELFSMTQASPKFRNDSISAFLGLQENVYSAVDSSRALPAATNSNPADGAVNMNVARQIRNQDSSINRLVDSVNELHGTMRGLQQVFTGLRTEFGTSATRDMDRSGGGMDMLRTLVTELGKKSEEIDKLRLENESLKAKIEVLEECNKRLSTSVPIRRDDSSMSGIQSPDFPDLRAQTRRERQSPFMQSSPHQSIADSFDDEYTEFIDAASGDEPAEPPPVKVPLKPADNSGNHAQQSHIEGSSNQHAAASAAGSRGEPQEPAAKRPRLASGTEEGQGATPAAVPENSAVPVKKSRGRPPGRPRKSMSQTSRVGESSFRVETPSTSARRGGRRARSASRRPPSQREAGTAASAVMPNVTATSSGANASPAHREGVTEQVPQTEYVNGSVADTPSAEVTARPAPAAQGSPMNSAEAIGEAAQRQAKRKSLVSAREALVRQVMEREEAMIGEQ